MKNAEIDSRFWSKVKHGENGCMIWIAAKNQAGYGMFWNGKKLVLATRWIYQQRRGPIPKGMDVGHLCDNPPCVNPAHLEAMSRRQNLFSSSKTLIAAKFRQTHCIHGHEFTPENTIFYGKHKRQRMCKACAAERMRQRYIPKPRQYTLATHCRRGHEFTPENTYWYGPDKKYRQCVACKQSRQKDWFADHPHYIRDRRRNDATQSRKK